ncbi:MAG: M16 family metallopeptidase [Saprospiraceae bacterium]
MLNRFTIVAALWIAAWGLQAQSPVKMPPGVKYLTSVEGINAYQLDNGLEVLLFPDPSKQVITVNVTYKVGSRHEGYGESGMAHLLEHLVFKGTPKHPNIPQELSERGARPNGTTSFDRTNYFETFEATEDNLRWALDLESDRMINSFIARKDLESEFSVVRSEYESGENSPFGVLYKRMLGTVFQWHNYGQSTIGEKSDIEGAPIERLQDFYRRYYQPDNAVLVVAGKIDEAKTLNLVNEYFGKIPRPARKLIPTYTREPTQDGERRLILRRVGDVQVVTAWYRIPAFAHQDYAALSVLANLMSDEPSGRLYKALVESKKAVSISGNASGFAEAGVCAFWTELRQEQSVEEAERILLETIESLKTHPPTEEEIEKAKTRLLKNFELFMKQSDRVGLALSNYIGQGDWRLGFMYRDALEKVTPADVARVALYYFKPANRSIGVFLPEPAPDRVEIPEVSDLAERVANYKGKALMAQGEDFDPSPENIEKRTMRKSLTNGMKYAMMPKENRGDAVNATISLRFGDLNSLKGKAVAGELTATMLDKGTQKRNRQQIKERQDELKARINVFGGATGVTVNIETDRAHLADAIRLAAEMLRTPSFPQEEFEKLIAEQLSAIEQQQSDPNALAGNAFQRTLNPYPADDPRYTRTFAEEKAAIQAMNIAQVRDFHKSFYGASDATAAIVGDFDPVEIEKVLKEAFGDWKSPKPYKRIESPAQAVAVQTQEIITPDKANAVYLAGYRFPMRNDDPDYPAVAIGGYIIGGGFLNSRLATRIRQKDGLSYTVRGSFNASERDANASFNAFMIYNPENVGKLESAFKEEIDRVVYEGFTDEELESAKSGWLKSRKVGRSSDAAIAGTLSNYLSFGRTMAWDADLERKVESLSKAQVNAAMKKYLSHDKMNVVKAGDFKRTGP